MAKPKDNERPMTDAEVDIYLREMHVKLGKKLDEIKEILPPGYTLTLIARHLELPGAQIILSNDKDFEAVSKALLDNKTKMAGLVSVDPEDAATKE